MKLTTRHKETPEQRDIRLAKRRREYRAWRAKNPVSPEQRSIRVAKDRARRANETPAERDIRLAKQRESKRARYEKESPEERAIRIAKQREYQRAWKAKESPEERGIRLAKQREYYSQHREATPEQRLERNSRCLKPYPKRFRNKVLADYASRGLKVSQRMLDELDGKRDPQTPPLFIRRSSKTPPVRHNSFLPERRAIEKSRGMNDSYSDERCASSVSTSTTPDYRCRFTRAFPHG